jgi:hypothetical protein
LFVTARAGVTVVESSPSRLVLDWELSGFEAVSILDDGAMRTLISFDGGYINTGDSGASIIPAYSIQAGVPPRGSVRVSVEPLELSSVRVADPLARRKVAPDSGEHVFVSRWVSEPLYGSMRGYRTAGIALRPVRELGQGRVQLLKRARIVIDFPAAPHTGRTWEPRGAYERTVRSLLLNFNAAQGWQPDGGLRRAAYMPDRESFPFTRDQRLATFRVGDGHRNGNETSTNENTLIRISGRRIRELFGNDIPIHTVSLFAATKGEMRVSVPREGEIPAGVFEIPIMRYDLNGNGMVDDDDYFIAYVSGASDWRYDASSYQFTFALNRLSDYRTYWLAAGLGSGGGGASLERFMQPYAAGAPVYDSFDANLYIREPRQLSAVPDNVEGGLLWTWRRFTMGRADTTILLDMPGLDRSAPGSIWFHRGHAQSPDGSSSISGIEARISGIRICSNCSPTRFPVNDWGTRELSIRFSNSTLHPQAFLELNGVQARYRRFLAIDDSTRLLDVFSSSESEAASRYRLTRNDAGGLVYVLRVPTDEQEMSLIDTTREATLTWSDFGHEGARYVVMRESDIVNFDDSLRIFASQPTVDARYQIRDLRSAGNRADYLIVTHEDFLAASLRLAAHKEFMGFSHPRVVLLDDILFMFGGSHTDPAAIRNFLLYVSRNWDGGADALTYVLLFGSGHYDYKQISTRNPIFMPVPYINNRFSDDFYVSFNPANDHDAFYLLGRLTAKSAAEAGDMVDKIIETEDPRVAEFDVWRNRMVMGSDDDQQGAACDPLLNHHLEADRTADIVESIRPDVDLRRLHLYEYEWDERFFKPAATRTLINEINSGLGVFGWFGHGAPDIIADERLLNRDNVAALHNRRRYPLFALFTCSAAKFDRPGEESLTEMLLRQPRAGVIAVVSAARETFPQENELLARPFFRALYDTTAGANLSVGSALAIAKRLYTSTFRNRYYIVMGDPSITLTNRTRGVDLSITDSEGRQLDTLKAMQQITIRGTVTDAQGRHDAHFGGQGAFASVTIFNPTQDSVSRKDGGTCRQRAVRPPTPPGPPIYKLHGNPVFSARVPIVNGEFEQQLLLPMNLAFGKPGVRLTAYVWREGDPNTGAGHLGGLIFQGTESGVVNDTVGPRISVRPVFNTASMDQAGLFVRNRVTAQLPLTLEVSIEDESGINLIGGGPDEGLTMEVRGAMSKRPINHLFRFSEGSFRQGTAVLLFEENALRSGTHELIISAQDLLGNVSKLSVLLDIVDPTEIKLDHVINVPNPVRMGRETRFYYHHSNSPGDLDVNVTIRIYSLGGRLLAVIRNPVNGEPWVPRDERGNLLTPNVYLYQVTATSPNIGRTVRSKIKKLVVRPPR